MDKCKQNHCGMLVVSRIVPLAIIFLFARVVFVVAWAVDAATNICCNNTSYFYFKRKVVFDVQSCEPF